MTISSIFSLILTAFPEGNNFYLPIKSDFFFFGLLFTVIFGISAVPIAAAAPGEKSEGSPLIAATSEILATQLAETEVTEATDKDTASVGISDVPTSETEVTEAADKKEGPVVIEVHRLSEKPNDAWEELKETVELRDVENKYPAKPPDDKVRIVFISDTHSKIDLEKFEVPNGDILIHAGDFTLGKNLQEIKDFNEWIGELPHKYKIAIAGNHDRMFDPKVNPFPEEQGQKWLTNCIYLEDSFVVVHGLKIYGSPWTPRYNPTAAFAANRGKELLEKWNKIPDDTDVLITHGPPLGCLDFTNRNVRAGCVDLFTTVQNRVKPFCHVFGHIHETHGMCTDGRTLFINAAIVDDKYRVVNKAFVVDVPSAGFNRSTLGNSKTDPIVVQFP